MKTALIYWYIVVCVECSLVRASFNKIKVIGSLLGPMSFPHVASWPDWQYYVHVYPLENSFKASQKTVDYPYNIPATIAIKDISLTRPWFMDSVSQSTCHCKSKIEDEIWIQNIEFNYNLVKNFHSSQGYY